MTTLKGKKILVADDEPMLREIIRDVLEFEGATVREAANGKEALNLILAEPSEAVISDIRMPGGDGLELLENLRKLNVATPVVLLITGFSDLSHDSAYQKGADAVLSKPFDVNELIDRLKFLLTELPARLEARPTPFPEVQIQGIRGDHVKLGRSGMFIKEMCDHHVGKSVSFDVECSELSARIKGAGVVRWSRKSSLGELPAGSGIEFVFLEPETLQPFSERVKMHPMSASIPDRI
jgi:CheY-like chemotaxis protein